MIHEATYIEGDKKLANNYHHSHIDDVFNLIKQANVNKSLITHISNRYNIDEVTSIYNELSLDQTSPHFYFVKDFDTLNRTKRFSQNTILGEKRFIYSSSLCDNSILYSQLHLNNLQTSIQYHIEIVHQVQLCSTTFRCNIFPLRHT